MIVEILDWAERDVRAGMRFYRRREKWLAAYFLESISADIESLALFAGTHRRIGRCHRSLTKRFPFAIYYTVEGEIAKVWAVLDCRRNPTWIKRQLNTRK